MPQPDAALSIGDAVSCMRACMRAMLPMREAGCHVEVVGDAAGVAKDEPEDDALISPRLCHAQRQCSPPDTACSDAWSLIF